MLVLCVMVICLIACLRCVLLFRLVSWSFAEGRYWGWVALRGGFGLRVFACVVVAGWGGVSSCVLFACFDCGFDCWSYCLVL